MFFKKERMNIAHRGARSIAPENTLLAAQRAIDVGADAWEIDVQLSSDGEPVILHDETLARTSDVRKVKAFSKKQPWFVRDFTLAELQTLDFGTWFVEKDPFGQIAAGAVTREELSNFKKLSILTLEEALTFSNTSAFKVNVEIKDLSGSPGHKVIVEKVVRWVDVLNMTDEILISSLNHSYLRQVNTDISVAVIMDVPHPDPVSLLRDLGAEAYHPHSEAVDVETISLLRREGFHVNVWTLNDETSMMKFIEACASGIITDFPQSFPNP
jgi:glycerophosphoryl diester phosphodiesterase